MNFVSVKTSGKKRLKVNIPFDKAFVNNLTIGDEGIFLFEYDVSSVQTSLPTNVTRAFFAITPTSDNLFASAVLLVDIGDEYSTKLLNTYGDEFSSIDCEVSFTEGEYKRLLLFLLSEVIERIPTKYALS
jgi:hypothetical protein